MIGICSDEDMLTDPRQLTLYCANGCGRKATTHSAVKIGPDGAGGHFVTSRLVCAECKAEEAEPAPEG